MPNGIVNSNAAAVAGGGAKDKHNSAERNVHLNKHCPAKCIVLCVVVLTQGARKHYISNKQVIGCKAAANRAKRGSILSKQSVKQVFSRRA